MVLVFSSVQRRRRARGAVRGSVSTSLFVTGYLVSWTVFGLAAYAAVTWVRSLSIGELSWSHDGRLVAGGVLVAAAVYQLTPAKEACLRRCRSPLELRPRALARGPPGRAANGGDPRRVLRRLLLDADGRTLRARADERHLDGCRGYRDRR
ncbi:MAG: hypothetical protein DLM63_05205 [Solirubrobacterales bacterium]|nr:MAG: hypothetical protein DLM63_05205 [Solirubrobacterales bacterium]